MLVSPIQKCDARLDPSTELVVCVLAAGSGRRFGGGKLDALLGGTPVGAHSVQAALSIEAPVWIVSAPDGPDFLSQFESSVTKIVNPRPSRGIGSSIKIGVDRAVKVGARRLLITLADMPFIQTRSLLELASFDGDKSVQVCASTYPDGSIGVPACFSSDAYSSLLDIEDRMGGKQALRAIDSIAQYGLPAAELIDIDRPGDLILHEHAEVL